jgi:uncharacterized protein YciI
MHFLVIGHDGPTFGIADRDVDEEHQTYMDGWLPRLLARGPLLSEDGEEHRGSIHVVEAEDLAAARVFATEEPYAAEGWYDEVTVTTYLPLLPGTMWDRPRPPRGARSSFVRATWTPRRPSASAPRLGDDWVFLGALLDTAGKGIGVAGALDLPEVDAEAAVRLLAPDADVTAQRWRRGGRDQG